MNISVVIPCFNEERSILKIVELVRDVIGQEGEIIIVDDGSTDGTRELLQKSADNLDAMVLYLPVNMGKGAALRAGFKAATKDIVIVQDADMEYDPADYAKMITPIENGHANVVFGSRFSREHNNNALLFWHRLGNHALTVLSNLFTQQSLNDMETGYKAFRREVIQAIEIEENRFGFEPEITAKVCQQNLQIHEVEITYRARSYADGKKITWRDGFWTVWCIVKYNLKALGMRNNTHSASHDTSFRVAHIQPHHQRSARH